MIDADRPEDVIPPITQHDREHGPPSEDHDGPVYCSPYPPIIVGQGDTARGYTPEPRVGITGWVTIAGIVALGIYLLWPRGCG